MYSNELSSGDDLSNHLNNLPRELFDEIKNLVFTAGPCAARLVRLNTKPPSRLRVSRATRKQFARSYFGGTRQFEVQGPRIEGMHEKEMQRLADFLLRWLTCIDPEHRGLIQEVMLVATSDAPLMCNVIMWNFAAMCLNERMQVQLDSLEGTAKIWLSLEDGQGNRLDWVLRESTPS